MAGQELIMSPVPRLISQPPNPRSLDGEVHRHSGIWRNRMSPPSQSTGSRSSGWDTSVLILTSGSAVCSNRRSSPLRCFLCPSLFPSSFLPFQHWVSMCEPRFWPRLLFRVLGVCYRQSCISVEPEASAPPKSLKAVGRTGSRLSPAITWRIEFLDTGSQDLEEPRCVDCGTTQSRRARVTEG